MTAPKTPERIGRFIGQTLGVLLVSVVAAALVAALVGLGALTATLLRVITG